MLIIDMPVYGVENVVWEENDYTVIIDGAKIKFNLANGEKVSSRYRAERPVR